MKKLILPNPNSLWQNQLIQGENLKVLKSLQANNLQADLIYIDPPFATNKKFFTKTGRLGYTDKFTGDNFLTFLKERLIIMRDILSDNGSIYVHIDHRMSHYVKIILDDIFGRKNFRNEIIWKYVSGGISDRSFAKKHDTIFFYTKSDNYTFNTQKERRKKYNQSKIEQDEKGEYIWYIRPGVNAKVPNGVKTYIDKYVSDVWDIPIVNPMAKERNGYPTQKPEALLQRIISASSNPGDLVIDLFAGSGTTGIVAQNLNRRWIMSDNSPRAIEVIKKRLKPLQDSNTYLSQKI